MRGASSYALWATALITLGTGVAAWFLLPPRVALYFTPTDTADLELEKWQFLALWTVGVCIAALAGGYITSSVIGIAGAFRTGVAESVGQLSTRVASLVLLWGSVAMWLVIWLGNDHPEKRSSLELFLGLSAVVGVILVIGVPIRRALRSAPLR